MLDLNWGVLSVFECNLYIVSYRIVFSVAHCQVFDLERMVKERDEMISELKTTDAERVDRLSRSLDERTYQLQQQNSQLEQHYKQIIGELGSRNEVLTAALVLPPLKEGDCK